jgi:hypothetical protein
MTHTDQVMLIGSCFTEHLGHRLSRSRFGALINPNGIVYNPISVSRCLDTLACNTRTRQEDLFEYGGLWHSWHHHGIFSKRDQLEALYGIEQAEAQGAAFLSGCNRLFLTLGTADVHLLTANQQVVANNHKAPASWFTTRRLEVQEITEALSSPLTVLFERNPDLCVVLTVSPVRHLRSGMAANQRSKAALLLACAELEAAFPNCFYFPAYELVMDDLRDYRFYASDMIHLSDAAIQYIWARFRQAFFDPETDALVSRLERLHQAVNHRPIHPGTSEHRQFAARQLVDIATLSAQHPGFNFHDETMHFEQILNS